ncbi:MAG TPA: nucleotidyltransferase domain-containing protein [Candidatus Atribacteria bacterium]|nr:nucleotidyltransferase domain-containing protein [Candidatus Atribacteria bacterium]
MYKHHEESIKNFADKLAKREDVLGLLVTGSIAHGFEKESSDIDVMIIVSDEEYNKRLKTSDLTYWENESCTYEDGYIDGKYVCPGFMKKVAELGSEPARFAFDGAIPVFLKIDSIFDLLRQIVRYPKEKKAENISRFYAQLQAWKWYYYEALKLDNQYLMFQALSNMVLFGGRIILAYNELLYPYHKWFLKVLEQAEHKPADLLDTIQNIFTLRDKVNIDKFYTSVEPYAVQVSEKGEWPLRFMLDSELNWLDGKTPVADL